MALIKCPECGQEVSDRTSACPKCGYPISEALPYGKVKIKVSAVNRNNMAGRQKVTISRISDHAIVWEGLAGEIAFIDLKGPVEVLIMYHKSALYFGGTCKGVIDPSKGKKYNVAVQQGFRKVVPILQVVDVIDSD